MVSDAMMNTTKSTKTRAPRTARSTINLKQTVAGSSSGWQTKKQQQKIWPPHCHRQQVLVGFFRRLTMVFADSCVSQTLAGRRL